MIAFRWVTSSNGNLVILFAGIVVIVALASSIDEDDDYLMALKCVWVRCTRALVRRQVGGRDGAPDDSRTVISRSEIDLHRPDVMMVTTSHW